ncbi:hypothetical protein G7K_4386-t1 [Saitoella complicata NRRL Y-17804]|uniref:Uncharacterized protein n=1 Tax=Saitoella complicata (strain BCRC 22490 / CBS 7301 / JCM 7358 / NBRC 10748 / NRRL Y-17804) TaxID=698492 RepID=A0A0E9NK85_SAICN|nr:hypothetical protein G7K_4386-t1 [Saitoella complicata NRRL Y-17804]
MLEKGMAGVWELSVKPELTGGVSDDTDDTDEEYCYQIQSNPYSRNMAIPHDFSSLYTLQPHARTAVIPDILNDTIYLVSS